MARRRLLTGKQWAKFLGVPTDKRELIRYCTLVREVLADALADQYHRLDEDHRTGLELEGAIRRYLNRAHLEDPAGGCPSAAFLSEIARQPLPTRKVYEEGLRSYASTLAALLPDADPEASRRRAIAIFGLLVGTLQLARAVPNAAEADQILEGGVEAALRLARMSSTHDDRRGSAM
ncbi:hypothetical protein [Inquilinus sp.]|jgi:TetR/AcrR family transcriptional repressor of nem operon|uniref:hypothetical protein n=1 Tax=Inquilinus sp. TaxID=1932117 RepID=UPI003784D7BC